MKKYDDADKVKIKADILEEFERQKLESDVSVLTLDGFLNWEERSEVASCLAAGVGCFAKKNIERQKWIT